MRKLYVILITTILAFKVSAQNYVADTLFTSLDRPVSFAFLPDDNIIMTHKTGPVKIYNQSGIVLSTFWDFSDSVNTNVECGVIGVCLDPSFSANHYVYIYYVNLTPFEFRVVKLIENNRTGINPAIIFRYQPGSINGNHVGGNLHFGSDGKLYLSIGDVFVDWNSQLRTNPCGKILRINPDGSIPADNPFYDDGNPNTGNDDRIWCLGLRNSFDFCFSPINDSLYAGENGFHAGDEVDFISKGKNYGWPICEGYCSPPIDTLVQPMHVWYPEISPTGIIIYNHILMPELNNHILIAGYVDGKIYKCHLANAPSFNEVDSVSELIRVANFSLTALAQGNDGYIYALTGGYIPGAFFRIKHNPIGIQNSNGEIPSRFNLFQNYPNPFNPSTKIKFNIPHLGIDKGVFIKLIVFDDLGRGIAVLVNQILRSGSYEVSWDAANYPSGIYFYKLSTDYWIDTKKMILLK